MRSCVLVFILMAAAFVAGQAVAEKDGYFRTSDGVRLHYLEAGSGPGMLFVPGWTIPAWIWDAQIRHFAAHYHVVALDLRSQGDSDKVSEGNYPGRHAQDIHELVENLKLAPVVLVGWSNGVPDLLVYAEQFGAASVRAYVLVDGAVWEKQDPAFVMGLVDFYPQLETNRGDFTEKFVRHMFRKPQPEDYLNRLVKASLQMPTNSAIAASVGAIAREDWRPAIRKLDRPVLVACQSAMKTQAADPIKSVLPSTRVELFEDAGHALFVDDADRFNSVMDDFLKHLPTQ